MNAASPVSVPGESAPTGTAVGRAIRLLLELSKARITFAVTFSVMTGWVLFTGSFSVEMLVPVIGVFLLACGSAALNQIQEWRVDAQMERTKNRPIPSGRITPLGATAVSLLFMAAGLNVLSYVEHFVWVVLGLGAFSVVFYNGIYYGLKRLTAFAVVPGAIIGAVPPLIGWCAAGGHFSDGRILEVGMFFFIWQIPHFWLLVHMFGKQYEGAGLPAVTAVMSPGQFKRITVVWTFLTIVCGLVLTLTHGIAMPWNVISLLAAVATGVAAIGFLQIDEPSAKDARKFFMQLNAYALAMMLLLMADALVA